MSVLLLLWKNIKLQGKKGNLYNTFPERFFGEGGSEREVFLVFKETLKLLSMLKHSN